VSDVIIRPKMTTIAPNIDSTATVGGDAKSVRSVSVDAEWMELEWLVVRPTS